MEDAEQSCQGVRKKSQLLDNLIDLYEAWGKPEDAEKWRAKLPTTENIRK